MSEIADNGEIIRDGKKLDMDVKNIPVFTPPQMEGNNISGNIAHLRDVFIEAEQEHIENLKQNPEIRKLIEELNKKSGTELAREAMKRIEKIEMGLVKTENLEKVESEIAILLVAIEDMQRERGLERNKQLTEDDEWER